MDTSSDNVAQHNDSVAGSNADVREDAGDGDASEDGDQVENDDDSRPDGDGGAAQGGGPIGGGVDGDWSDGSDDDNGPHRQEPSFRTSLREEMVQEEQLVAEMDPAIEDEPEIPDDVDDVLGEQVTQYMEDLTLISQERHEGGEGETEDDSSVVPPGTSAGPIP